MAAGGAAAGATPFVTGLGAAFHFLLGPVGLVIAGIAGLVYLLSKLDGATEDSTARMSRLEREAYVAAGTLEGDLSPAMGDAVAAIDRVSEAAGEQTSAFETSAAAQDAYVRKQQRLWDDLEKGAARATAKVKSEVLDVDEAVKALRERISLESERIDTGIEIVRARFELLSRQLDPVKDKATLLTASLAAQEDEMDLLEDKIRATSASYEEMKRLKGENSAEAQALALELVNEKIAWEDLRKEIEETKKAATVQESPQSQALAMIQQTQADLLVQGKYREAARLQTLLDPSFKPTTGMAGGGILYEPVVGVGLRSGDRYTFAETGPEEFGGVGRLGKDVTVHVTENVYIYGPARREDVEAGMDRANRSLVTRLRLAMPGRLT